MNGENAPWLLEAFDEHLNNIREFQDLAEGMGADFVALSVNLFRTSEFHARAADLLETEMPHFMDLGRHVRESKGGRRTTWRYDPHWNRLGNRLAGEGVYRYLDENGLLDPGPRRTAPGGDVSGERETSPPDPP